MQGRRLAISAAVLLPLVTFALFPWLLTNIFSSIYLPHGFCFLWNTRLLRLHVVSDLIIWLSYTGIAMTLAVLLVRFRRVIHFRTALLLFATFIIACGFTHLLEIVVLWRPLYWLEGDAKLLTAFASLITAVTLPFCIPELMRMRARMAASADNERRFLAAAQSSLDGFLVLESVRETGGEIVDFQVVFANENAARLVNIRRERLVGSRLCELLPQSRDGGFFAAYKRVVVSGTPYVAEFPVSGYDDANAVEWLKIQIIKLDDGVAVTASDISDRKRLEIERTAAFAESLIDRSPAAVIVTDPEYQIRALNPAAREMLRYSHDELIGRETPLIFFDPAEVERAAGRAAEQSGAEVSPHQVIFESGLVGRAGEPREWTFVRKDGSAVFVEVTVTPLKSDADLRTGFMITAYDISERKRREEATANASSQIEAVSRSQMIIEFGLDGSILEANENYLRVFGYTVEELVGAKHDALVPEEDRNGAAYRMFWENLRAGRFQSGEFQRVGKDGREIWVDASYNPIFNRDGAPTRVLKFATDVTERVKARAQIREAEARLRAILDNVVDGIITIDSAGTIASVNPAAIRMFGYQANEMVGLNVKTLMPEPDASQYDGHFSRHPSGGDARIIGVGREIKGLRNSGNTFPMEITITEVAVGGQRLFVGLLRDMTERKHAEQEAQRARAFRESLIESSPAAIIVTDVDFTISAINPAAQKMLWYQPEELVGRGTPLIFYSRAEVSDRAKRLASASGQAMSLDQAVFAAALEPGGEHEGEWTFFRKGGSSIMVQVSVTPLKSEDGIPTGFMITAYDISERKRREDYISHLAHHDVLTGLPTRQLLMDRLTMMISRSQRSVTRSALLMIDLNDFKHVNDSLGHHVGDRLLIEVADRLRGAVRSIDTVARMGGDEFVVLVSELGSVADAEQVARKLLAAFRSPFTLTEQSEITVTASIGICVYPDGGADAGALLRNADVAMYHAKATHGQHYQIFDQKIADLVLQQRETEAALTAALDGNEFQLHYQPQFSLASGAMVGVEALLRWHSKQFGPVAPHTFIPVAEASGLILPIGVWVIRTACAELRSLQARFGSQMVMAVNLSARQLDQPDLLAVIQQAIVENDLDPACLEIEITESLLMSDSANASAFFEGLRTLGVRVAIDDFGTGFSSMAYLLRFSVNRLKIDRCFIQDCPENSNSATVTSAIIALAHELKVSVVAEGVESEAQMDFLKAAGCDDVQGFHLCRPVPAAQIPSTLAVLSAS